MSGVTVSNPRLRINSEAATRRGAALLDEKMPGWHDKIDLERLQLASLTQCVLGQLFPEPQTVPTWRYYDYDSREQFIACLPSAADAADAPVCTANFALGRQVLGLNAYVCRELGFDELYDVRNHRYRTVYSTLEAAWIRRVRERQQQGETE